MLTTQSIEKALALCGKIMSPTNYLYDFELENKNPISWTWYFSYPKFFYYLLSPEFIEKYLEKVSTCFARDFWQAIYEYQSGNEERLQNLLSKIP